MDSDEKTLIVVFGGMDRTRLETYGCGTLRQTEFGPTDVSQFNPREPSIIMASLITGVYPCEHGIENEYIIDNPLVRRVYDFMRTRSESTRQAAGRLIDIKKRRPIASDIAVPTIFEKRADSIPLFIPSYNPEIAWCVDRNVISPLDYPALGTEAAEELLQKNFEWRKRRCLEAIENENGSSFVMCHFQKLDSVQHLYYKYEDDERRIRQTYHDMDEFAAQLKRRAQRAGFGRIDFMSEHGLPRDDSLKHEDTGFYSSNVALGLDRPKIVEFYDTWNIS